MEKGGTAFLWPGTIIEWKSADVARLELETSKFLLCSVMSTYERNCRRVQQAMESDNASLRILDLLQD